MKQTPKQKNSRYSSRKNESIENTSMNKQKHTEFIRTNRTNKKKHNTKSALLQKIFSILLNNAITCQAQKRNQYQKVL